MKTKRQAKLPVPVKTQSRICFGIAWFSTLSDAMTYAAYVEAKGYTYNGGFFHGMGCGRDESFDYTDAVLGKLYAVTD